MGSKIACGCMGDESVVDVKRGSISQFFDLVEVFVELVMEPGGDFEAVRR